MHQKIDRIVSPLVMQGFSNCLGVVSGDYDKPGVLLMVQTSG